MAGRKTFSTGTVSTRASSTSTAPFAPTSPLSTALSEWKGNGPIQGTPKPVGVLVFGDDPVAVDATCARVAGLNPEKIDYLMKASLFLGNVDEPRILQVGESISAFASSFEVIPQFLELRH